MEQRYGAVLIVAACGVIFLIGVLHKKAEWLMQVAMRSILGTLAIYFTNSVLASWGISLGVGINAVTVLTSGILGFPGLIALYGIGIYKTL